MEDKFIRTVPPLSLAIIAVFDAVSLFFCGLAAVALWRERTFFTAAFMLMMLVDIVIAVRATHNVWQSGVLFEQDAVPFTALDGNNGFRYNEVNSAEVYKDSRVSLKKTYTERYSSVILHLTDCSTVTVELGATTKKKLRPSDLKLQERIKQDGAVS